MTRLERVVLTALQVLVLLFTVMLILLGGWVFLNLAIGLYSSCACSCTCEGWS